jgi:photosystem II stability/assembly factor-like uncharacterized protein
MTTTVLVATDSDVRVVDPGQGTVRVADGLRGQLPTCLAADPLEPDRAWCGTRAGGVFRSDDAGASWSPAGLADASLMAIVASPVVPDLVWAGTEPSAVWRSEDGGRTWQPTADLETLPSSPEWAFPPRPETHHVRWIACHPTDTGRLWVAIEAGALVHTRDGGRTWHDRVPGGPWDTHELAIHPAATDTLRVAAGDGYFQSSDGGRTWASPADGLDVSYLRSVAIDPGDPATVVVSAASRPRTTYVAGHSDGRLYRRTADDHGPWTRVARGWPDPPDTIAPLLAPGSGAGQLWAADERGVHHSDDGGASWHRVATFDPAPRHLRGLAVRPSS